MIKAIVGLKGSGKTKTLVGLANNSANNNHGDVVYIEKGNKLIYEVSYRARLVDIEQYSVSDYETMYGFLAGLIAGNHDIMDIYIDGINKICGTVDNKLDDFLLKTEVLTNNNDVNVTLTISTDANTVSDVVKKFVFNIDDK